MGLVALRHVNPPGPGIEPMSPALADRFLTTGPPGKSLPSASYTLLSSEGGRGDPKVSATRTDSVCPLFFH